MIKRTIPAISIVIPMYNAEKYIGECLDSILAQTFDDYEVIVVDNCSTDNSAAIVESYVPKFTRGGVERLQLVRRKVNSGSAAVPRNTGTRLSRGEYLMFVDSDDAITETALAELYPIAKKFDADIVHCEKFYHAPGETVTTDKNLLKPFSYEKINFVEEPVLISENLAERVRDYGTDKFSTSPWNHLFRRQLVAEHDLNFPAVTHGEDEIFDFYALCLAKNYVRVPNIVYVYREHSNSMLHKTLSVEKYIHDWYASIFKAIGIFDEFMNKFELFRTNPEYKYLIFDSYTRKNLPAAVQIYAQIPAGRLDELIRAEVDKAENKTALASFLFSRMNIFNLNLLQQQQIIQRQQQQIQQLQAQLQSQASQLQLQTENIFKP